ncbi:MAG: 16S rRNA (guanine(527)-N(7))-methyltransferase RsmG [Candidatus Chromulinivorax sp.]
MILEQKTEQEKKVWQIFVDRFSLTEKQQEQFISYLTFLLEQNEKFNITAITDFSTVIQDHFTDSLALSEWYDLRKINQLIDVGSGGGLPGIPLKILYPHLAILLIEVNQKKVQFLQEVATRLALDNLEICDQDWRGFIRSYDQTTDLVISRAALPVSELIRMFKPSSKLAQAKLVYWASQHWIALEQEQKYIVQDQVYHVHQKTRRLIFLQGNHRG